jgi:hypothetical protein
MKVSPQLLKKAEELLQHSGLKVRYEKGTFQSGYCLIHQSKVVVVNKFLPIEGKFNAILEIFFNLNIPFEQLSEEDRKWLEPWKQAQISF